jgi:hypothetical protein
MFTFYLKVLGLNLGVTNFVLLMAAFVHGGLQAGDFIFPNAIHFVSVTLIFISLDLFATDHFRNSELSRKNFPKE